MAVLVKRRDISKNNVIVSQQKSGNILVNNTVPKRRKKAISVTPSSSGITYEFTRNADLIKQYCAIRNKVFTSVWQLSSFDGEQDIYDHVGKVLIVKKGNKCIAGTRFVIHRPGSELLLPLESEDFRLKDVLPELGLENATYGDCSRVAIDPNYRNGAVSTQIFKIISKAAIELNCQYLFGISPTAAARRFRRIHKNLGFKTEICEDIKIPERETYEGIEMKLIMVELQSKAIELQELEQRKALEELV